MDEPGGNGRFEWFGDPMSRRAVFGLLGFTLLAAACGGNDDPGADGPSTPAPSSDAAEPGSAASVVTAAPTSAAPAPPTEVPTTAAPTTSAPIVPGSNANITEEILTSDAESYGGAWAGTWSFDDATGSGTVRADVVIDVTGRLVSGRGVVEGPMLSEPVPPIDVAVSVDAWTYGEDGTFDITVPTAVGPARATSDGGFGRFRLAIDVADRADAVTFEAAGVANVPSLVPLTFTITAPDGSTRTGTVELHPV